MSDLNQPQETEQADQVQEESPAADPSQEQVQDQADQEAGSAEGEGEGEEGQAEGNEETPAAPAKPEEKHKRTGGFQRKIDRLERQNQILLEQLQRSGQQPPVPQAPPKQLTPQEKAADEFRAMVRQAAQTEIQQLQAQHQHQARQAEFQRRAQEVRAAHPDFDDAIAGVDHIPTSDALRQAILTSEKAPEIMYQLAKNPAELARLSALSPLDAAREVGRLEAKASGATPQTLKPASRPPAPPSKVNGSAPASTRRWDDLPLAEHKRLARKR